MKYNAEITTNNNFLKNTFLKSAAHFVSIHILGRDLLFMKEKQWKFIPGFSCWKHSAEFKGDKYMLFWLAGAFLMCDMWASENCLF